jgi:hypothetical protein
MTMTRSKPSAPFVILYEVQTETGTAEHSLKCYSEQDLENTWKLIINTGKKVTGYSRRYEEE